MPAIPTPAVEPSPTWLSLWREYELTLSVGGKSSATIRSCRSVVLTLARHATAAELEPADVTRAWMLDYLLRQKEARKGGS